MNVSEVLKVTNPIKYPYRAPHVAGEVFSPGKRAEIEQGENPEFSQRREQGELVCHLS